MRRLIHGAGLTVAGKLAHHRGKLGGVVARGAVLDFRAQIFVLFVLFVVSSLRRLEPDVAQHNSRRCNCLPRSPKMTDVWWRLDRLSFGEGRPPQGQAKARGM